MNNYKNQTKLSRFIKNNMALLVIIFCIFAILGVVLVSYLVTDQPDVPVDNNPDVNQPDDNQNVNQNPNEDDNQANQTPEPEPIETFSYPLEFISVGMEHCDGQEIIFVYNSTLNTWRNHKGVDLIAQEGTKVSAMKSGTIVEVGNNYEMGWYVVIDHGDGVVATYASLGEPIVVEGQKVEKGQEIGEVSTSASYEFSQGAHLHLEIEQNGQHVNPIDFIENQPQ